MTFPAEVEAGARAMYERQSQQVGGLPAWRNLAKKTQDSFCADFAAGLAAYNAHLMTEKAG